MKKFLSELWRLVVIIVLGGLGSLIAGLMVYGGDVFEPLSTAFAYYIAYGLSSACIFAFYHVKGLSNSISAAMVIGVLLFLAITFIMPVKHALIYSFGVTVSVVLLAFLFEKKLSYLKHWKFIIVGIIFGELFVLLNLISLVGSKGTIMSAEVFQKNFLDGLWMGFGLGIGIEIAESLIHSVDIHRASTTPQQPPVQV
ncbi:MAG: hypothetical protein N3A63_06860 [Bacteroidetes bacterium]|nr:hypothetical protein [Bacteroidota bacterium]